MKSTRAAVPERRRRDRPRVAHFLVYFLASIASYLLPDASTRGSAVTHSRIL